MKYILTIVMGFIVIAAASLYYVRHLDGDQEKLVSTDGKCSVMVPGSWSEVETHNPIATLGVMNSSRKMYVEVLTEKKPANTTISLDEYARLVVKDLETDMKGTHDAVESLVLHGMQARRVRMTGLFEGSAIVYSITVLDGRSDFHRVVGRSLKVPEAEAMPVLTKIADTFELIDYTLGASSKS